MNIKLYTLHIYQSTSGADDAAININMVGSGGGPEVYRNTIIGNGKGSAVLSVEGATSSVEIDGKATLYSASVEGLVLKSSLSKASTDLVKAIFWQDSSDILIGSIGYDSTADNVMRIVNTIAPIEIIGADFVNIRTAIKENGVLLSDKYMSYEAFEVAQSEFARLENTYTRVESDSLFGTKLGGLSQFIVGPNTAETLRSQIGAVGNDAPFAKLDRYLADMATTEVAKRTIRENIGAAKADSFQERLFDSGWTPIADTSLYIRQIGNVVSIQGTVKTAHKGVAFTIPNTIQPPTYAVYQSVSFANNKNWCVKIERNSRMCEVVYCDGSCDKNTCFSLTYMI